jgi:hypothetical protein
VNDQPEELTRLPKGFPTQLTDEELAAAIDLIIEKNQWSMFRIPDFGGQVLAPLLTAGVNEQSRRLLDRSIAHAEQTADESRRTNRRSFRITLAALVVAALSSVVAVTSAVFDYRGDKDWQDEQVALLTEIRDRLPPPP